MAQPAGAGAGGGRGRELRMSIEEVAKKLSLWHTPTFRPILTHDELEPILGAAGFVPLPAPAPRQQQQECLPPAGAAGAVAWREYAFLGCNANAAARRRPAGPGPRPRPRLPYPRLDGLHLKTYEAFLGAVEAHLGADRVSNLFHVRYAPPRLARSSVASRHANAAACASLAPLPPAPRFGLTRARPAASVPFLPMILLASCSDRLGGSGLSRALGTLAVARARPGSVARAHRRRR